MSAGPRRPGRGRRPGASGTRAAILAVARRLFAERGYDAASIRDIASEAGVDPALVHHYFGTKEGLFTSAMRLPNISEILATTIEGDPAALSEGRLGDLVRRVMLAWEEPALQRIVAGLLRSALTRPAAAAMLREAIAKIILGQIVRALGSPDAELRASLAATQMFGLFMARYLLRLEPIASLPKDDVVRLVAPTLQRYLTSDLGPMVEL